MVYNANAIVRKDNYPKSYFLRVYLILPIIILMNLFCKCCTHCQRQFPFVSSARKKCRALSSTHHHCLGNFCELPFNRHEIWSTLAFLLSLFGYNCITGQRDLIKETNATINRPSNKRIRTRKLYERSKQKECDPLAQKKKTHTHSYNMRKTFAFAPPIIIIIFICLEKYFRRIIIIKFSI